MAKIVIGIPCFQSMPPETETDYMRLMYYLGRRYPEHDFFLAIKRKAEQFRARNAIVEAAYQAQADYLWMLDDDQVIDTEDGNNPSERYEILRRLLEHFAEQPEAGIIGALYYHRGGECRPVLMTHVEDGRYRYLRDDEIRHGLQEVDVQGGGCMLIKMRVFDKIGAAPFDAEHEYGTDFQICRKAKAAGFRVFCDTSIELGHVKNERSIVTGANRHLHYAETTAKGDRIIHNATVGRILREFRADVMEYFGIDSVAVLLDLANKYIPHHLGFEKYRGNLRQYYIDSEASYLARACFIRSDENQKAFDAYVIQVIKADVPGVGLDFGCGSAPITFDLCRRGQVLYFCDIPGTKTFDFLKWRAAKYGLAGTKALFIDTMDDAANWPHDESLDYVTCLDSIEHLPEGEWQELVRRVACALKPSGCLITNFMLLKDDKNTEHIFMDKAEFSKVAVQNKLFPINAAIFQKRRDFDAR